jgi:endonuclease/exonuclease/phosphatase (EEP) superfamily protein YafD
MARNLVLRHLIVLGGWSLVIVPMLTLLSLAVRVRTPKVLALQGIGWVQVLLALSGVVLGALLGRSHLWRVGLVAALCWFALGMSVVLSSWHARSQGGESLRVVSANLLWSNEDRDTMVVDITRQDPDVLVTLETTLDLLGHLRGRFDGRLQPVAYGETTATTWAVIWSSQPPVHTEKVSVGNRELPVAVFRHAGSEITVVGVHTKSPVDGSSVRAWEREFAGLERYVGTLSGPVVLAGDFNAALTHRPMRRLLGDFTDAASARGGLFVPTWPTIGVGVPLLSLDHVLLRGVKVSGFDTFTLAGSDHLGVRADVVVPTSR